MRKIAWEMNISSYICYISEKFCFLCFLTFFHVMKLL